jgi:hypothetical protein
MASQSQSLNDGDTINGNNNSNNAPVSEYEEKQRMPDLESNQSLRHHEPGLPIEDDKYFTHGRVAVTAT